MSQTPDRKPGALEEDEEIRLVANVTGPTQAGAFNYDGSTYVMRDALGTFDPRGVDYVRHGALRQLIHLADGVGGPMEEWTTGAFRETLPTASPFPTSVIWWTDSGKTMKIAAKLITFDGQKRVTQVQWSAYASDGTTVIAQVTDVIAYSTVFETSRTRTIT